MSITSTSFKYLTMAESCLLPSPSSLFYNKTKPSSLFLLPSKPLKLHFSSLNSSSHSLSSLTSKSVTHRSLVPLCLAQEGDTLTILQDEETVAETNWEPNGEESTEEGLVEPSADAKLFVGNLPYDFDSQKLAMLFEQAGTVEIAEVIYNRETDQSRGFGFVTMSTVEEAETGVEKFNRYDIDGRLLNVNKAAPKGSRPERPPRTFEASLRVYVGNLPWDIDNSRLEQIFSEHGKVVSARVVYDRETSRSRGFGFVTFSDETEMNDAIAALDGQDLDGRMIRVSVAEDRRRSSF